MIDLFQEIWSTVRKNKLRTFLTGFSVSWGIFLLIILLASGNGLQSGMTENFRFMSSNLVRVNPGWTSKPYKGYQKNRRIELKTEDIENVRIDHPEVVIEGGDAWYNKTISYGKHYGSYKVAGVGVNYLKLDVQEMLPGRGRFINEMDIRERRKVIVVSPRLESILFRDADGIGKQVNVEGILFTIVGVYDAAKNDNNPPVFIPLSTAHTLYDNSGNVSVLRVKTEGLDTKQANEDFNKRVRQKLAQRHTFDENDMNAVWMWNTSEDSIMMKGIFSAILLFMWVVGIGTLIAGIVGVSNIMLIAVRERTKEFGIRKAIGAKPWDIIKLVLIESVIITAVFGYIGMMAGIGISELANSLIEQMNQAGGSGNVPFRHPEVPLGVVITANVILIIAGVLAGYFPARKAVNVTAVEAMKAE